MPELILRKVLLRTLMYDSTHWGFMQNFSQNPLARIGNLLTAYKNNVPVQFKKKEEMELQCMIRISKLYLEVFSISI